VYVQDLRSRFLLVVTFEKTVREEGANQVSEALLKRRQFLRGANGYDYVGAKYFDDTCRFICAICYDIGL
jgi:hypothetical protein